MELDKLKLLSGDPIEISGITLYQPRLSQIRDIGEAGFYNTFWTLCSSAWDMPSMFDDLGINFMEVSDWEFFRAMLQSSDPQYLSLIFGELDLTKLEPRVRTKQDESQDIVLFNPENNFVFDEEAYKNIIAYIREMIGFTHKGRKAGNEATRKILIMDDRNERKRNKNKPFESLLFSTIISLVNTEEFSYTYDTVFNLTIYQLTKSLTQIQGKKSAMALLQGSMSGFADMSKVPAIDMSWIYSDEKYKPKARKLVNQTTK